MDKLFAKNEFQYYVDDSIEEAFQKLEIVSQSMEEIRIEPTSIGLFTVKPDTDDIILSNLPQYYTCEGFVKKIDDQTIIKFTISTIKDDVSYVIGTIIALAAVILVFIPSINVPNEKKMIIVLFFLASQLSIFYINNIRSKGRKLTEDIMKAYLNLDKG